MKRKVSKLLTGETTSRSKESKLNIDKNNVIDFEKAKRKIESTSRRATERLAEAQELVLQAWDLQSKAERVKLAKKALKISEDCADAYILLGLNEAKSLQEQKEIYQKALEAGRRAIGEVNFKFLEGRFWGFIETRPYMRAKWAFADTLWKLGERAEAIGHAKDMMRLNPNDHQGVRYILINWLIEEKDFRWLENIFDEFKEDITAAMRYSEALYYFKKGDREKAEKKLRVAIEANPFVPLYLTGKKKLPVAQPSLAGLGDEYEAQNYIYHSVHLWKGTRGSRKWLGDTLKKFAVQQCSL